MLSSLAFIVLIALLLSGLFEKIRIPGFLGMICAGLLAGPVGKELIPVTVYSHIKLPDVILSFSSELKSLALIVLLIRVGLSLKKEELFSNSRVILEISTLPFILETSIITLVAFYLLRFSIFESLMTGVILTSVSPAIIVPSMLSLKEKGVGANIPTVILAGATLENIFVLTVFGALTNVFLFKGLSLPLFLMKVPLSIFVGIGTGIILGYALVMLFNKYDIRDTIKVVIFIAISILLYDLKKFLPIESLICIMVMGFMVLEMRPLLANKMASKFNKVWVIAELVLFVLVGAQINTGLALSFVPLGLCVIFTGLAAKLAGVYVSLLKSGLNHKEKIFCMASFIPKATIQAALGAVPLSLGLNNGNAILALAVLSIFVTAPMGGLFINRLVQRMVKT
jgi:solute carrier family 9B (sodium/hydrogen exchanger), member 1/2